MEKFRDSYWESELLNQHFDLVVIGAGITGLSSALFFKKENPNARIIVLERGKLPMGASTRNAGFACIGSVGELLSDLKLEDEERVFQRVSDRLEGLNLLRSTLDDSNIDYEACGGWEIFNDDKKFEQAKNAVPKLNTQLEQKLSESEVYSVDKYNGFPAIFNRLEGMLHPTKMIRTLVQQCILSGIEFRWKTMISKVDFDSKKIISDDGFTFQFQKLIIATNAFTKSLIPTISIEPGRGYVFVTHTLPELTWKGTFHYDNGYVYFRNIGTNRLLIGGGRHTAMAEETTSQFGINESIKNYLVSFSKEVLKLPNDFEIEFEWSGIMGFTPSKSYILQQLSETTVIAAGLSGMGVALGMNLGKKAASLV